MATKKRPIPFILFAQKRRLELRTEGKTFQTFTELLDFVRPDWIALPSHEKNKYKVKVQAQARRVSSASDYQKKKPTAYVLFAQKRRLELRTEGKTFQTFTELLDFVRPDWIALPSHQKDKLKAEVQARRAKLRGESTSTSDYLENKRIKEEEFKLKLHEAKLEESVKMKKSYEFIDNLLTGGEVDIKSKTFILVHANAFSSDMQNKKNLNYLPAELAFSAFTLEHGIVDNYWVLIDPIQFAELPGDSKDSVNHGAEVLGIPTPGYEIGVYDDNRKEYLQKMVSDINMFLSKHDKEWSNSKNKSSVFCLKRDMDKVGGCMDWIYEEAGIDGMEKNPLKLHSYEHLVLAMYDFGRIEQVKRDELTILPVSEHIRKSENYKQRNPIKMYTWSCKKLLKEIRGQDESVSFEFLDSIIHEDQLEYLSANGIFLNEMQVEICSRFGKDYNMNKSLACLHHQENERVRLDQNPLNLNYLPICSLHTVNRQAYIILEHLAPSYGLDLEEGKHTPASDPYEESERRNFLLGRWGQFGYTQQGKSRCLIRIRI